MKAFFKSRLFRLLLGLLVTAVALWLSLRRIDWGALKEALLRVDLFWVAVAVLNTLLTVYALGVRWQLLLGPEKTVSLNDLFRLNIVSQFVNIIMPARLGEVLRAYLASRNHGISGAFVAGTIVIEKVLDFLVFVALWVLVPIIFAVREQLKGSVLALILGLLTLGLILLFIWRRDSVLKAGRRFSLLLPSRWRDRFVDFFDRSLEAFGLLRNAGALLVQILLTLVFVGGQVLTNFFLFKAFGLDLSVWAALFLLLALQVGNIPPSSPGKVGVFEFAVILALSVFGIPKSQALSYGLVLHAVAFLPKVILGLVYGARLDISVRKKYSMKDDEI